MSRSLHNSVQPEDRRQPVDGRGIEPAVDDGPRPSTSGYTQILRSTALVGGASAINIAFGIIRTKAMALLLGPAGMGVWGLFNSIADLAFSLAGMGVQSSAVQRIVESAGSDDRRRIGRTITALRRLTVILGVLGAAVLLFAAGPISQLTFDTRDQVAGVALVGVAVFLRVVGGGQSALLQGLRRVPEMARMSVFGGLLGTITTVPLVYFFREQGILPAIVVSAGAGTLVSWWYCRRESVATEPLRMGEFARESSSLLKLGFAFLASSFVMMATAYFVRIIILRTIGFEATGLYQSAWMLCGLYVGFILQAMGADFYPRLTASAHDNVATTRLVNEQTRIAVLLGGPGAMATLSLAPLVIDIFYSSNFTAAVGVLRWLCLGVALRLIIWPMAIIPIAKARQLIFMSTDLTWGVANVLLTWALVPVFGLEGAGMAFFGAYVINGLLMFLAVRKISEFRWTADNIRLMTLFLPGVGLVFVAVTMLSPYLGTAIGLVFSLGSGVFSLRNLVSLVPREKLPAPMIALCVRCRLIPA